MNLTKKKKRFEPPSVCSQPEIRDTVRPDLPMIFAEGEGENEFSSSSKLFWRKENDLLRMMDLQWPSVTAVDGRSEEKRDYREIRGQEIQFMGKSDARKKMKPENVKHISQREQAQVNFAHVAVM